MAFRNGIHVLSTVIYVCVCSHKFRSENSCEIEISASGDLNKIIFVDGHMSDLSILFYEC